MPGILPEVREDIEHVAGYVRADGTKVRGYTRFSAGDADEGEVVRWGGSIYKVKGKTESGNVLVAPLREPDAKPMAISKDDRFEKVHVRKSADDPEFDYEAEVMTPEGAQTKSFRATGGQDALNKLLAEGIPKEKVKLPMRKGDRVKSDKPFAGSARSRRPGTKGPRRDPKKEAEAAGATWASLKGVAKGDEIFWEGKWRTIDEIRDERNWRSVRFTDGKKTGGGNATKYGIRKKGGKDDLAGLTDAERGQVGRLTPRQREIYDGRRKGFKNTHQEAMRYARATPRNEPAKGARKSEEAESFTPGILP